jgi:chemotaxis protein CheD
MNVFEVIPKVAKRREIVSVADMVVTRDPGTVLVTHALGSCLGVAVYDPDAMVGGLLHVMMAKSAINPDRAKEAPYTFVDTGLPMFLQELMGLGADRERWIVKVCGGAQINGHEDDRFSIGKKNYIMLRKVLWKSSVLIDAEDVGGTIPRTMSLDMETGEVCISTAGQKQYL